MEIRDGADEAGELYEIVALSTDCRVGSGRSHGGSRIRFGCGCGCGCGTNVNATVKFGSLYLAAGKMTKWSRGTWRILLMTVESRQRACLFLDREKKRQKCAELSQLAISSSSQREHLAGVVKESKVLATPYVPDKYGIYHDCGVRLHGSIRSFSHRCV